MGFVRLPLLSLGNVELRERDNRGIIIARCRLSSEQVH